MTFTLPKLPYEYKDLEPAIDSRTMEIHYTKHHQGYVDKLNAALENEKELASEPIEELMRKIDEIPMEMATAVRNNGGGHYNHSLFWTVMTKGGKKMSGGFEKKLAEVFGSADSLKEKFAAEAMGRFGSGWAWLVVEGPSASSGQESRLQVCSTANQDNPLMKGNVPILGLDVWEHAYYLNYQNRRADYVAAWWNIVNWEEVERRFTGAGQTQK